MADNNSEITAQQAIDIVEQYPEQGGQNEQEQEVVGAIYDQDEALAFMQWLMGPEGCALAQQLREQKAQAEGAGE